MDIQLKRREFLLDEQSQFLHSDLDKVRKEIYARLVQRLDADFDGVDTNLQELQEEFQDLTTAVEHDYAIELEAEEKLQVLAVILDELRGTGPLAALLADPQVSDILINGPEEIWVDRRGRLTKTEIRFDDS